MGASGSHQLGSPLTGGPNGLASKRLPPIYGTRYPEWATSTSGSTSTSISASISTPTEPGEGSMRRSVSKLIGSSQPFAELHAQLKVAARGTCRVVGGGANYHGNRNGAAPPTLGPLANRRDVVGQLISFCRCSYSPASCGLR